MVNDDLATLVELARENRGRLVIQTGSDGDYRVQLDYPNGCAAQAPSLGSALFRVRRLAEMYPAGAVRT